LCSIACSQGRTRNEQKDGKNPRPFDEFGYHRLFSLVCKESTCIERIVEGPAAMENSIICFRYVFSFQDRLGSNRTEFVLLRAGHFTALPEKNHEILNGTLKVKVTVLYRLISFMYNLNISYPVVQSRTEEVHRTIFLGMILLTIRCGE
jgi:hypothetical protein